MSRHDKPLARGASKPAGQITSSQPSVSQKMAGSVTHYQGNIVPPEMLQRLEDLVPGTAARVMEDTFTESAHRRAMEAAVNHGNIAAQAKQGALAEKKLNTVRISDLFGQGCGLLLSLCCIGGAVYLALNGHDWAAGGLCAIPTAAVVQAFRARSAT